MSDLKALYTPEILEKQEVTFNIGAKECADLKEAVLRNLGPYMDEMQYLKASAVMVTVKLLHAPTAPAKVEGVGMTREALETALHIIRVDIRNICMSLSLKKETDNGPDHKELCQIGNLLDELIVALRGLDAGTRDEAVNDFRMDELDAVMHSVDKWLEGDELKENPATRAARAREKALCAIEDAGTRGE